MERKVTSIKVEKELWKQFKAYCLWTDRTLCEVHEQALKEFLEDKHIPS